MIQGSCLCGAVRYEIRGAVSGYKHCHCRTCRKVHGTVYGSSALTSAHGFSVIAGETALKAYRSSPGKLRNFCSECGSHLFAVDETLPGKVILRVGTFDGEPEIAFESHICVGEKAPWYEITDELPRYADARE